MRKIVCFFPHCIDPPETGAHRRCLEMISGLQALECSVTLLSAPFSSHTRWDAAAIDRLRCRGVGGVRLYHLTAADRAFVALVPRIRRRLLGSQNPMDSVPGAPPGMRAWFNRTLDELAPDGILINYANWDGLLDHARFAATVRVIENHDLLTLNLAMWRAAKQYLPPGRLSAADVGEAIVSESFYEARRLAADPEEFRIYDRYHATVAISNQEAETIRRYTQQTRVVLIPVTFEPQSLRNQYSGAAFLPTGPNVFNLQGCLYFIKKVLPLVLRAAPDFSLRIAGSCSQRLAPAGGIALSGYVPDLAAVYATAPFLVCPIFGGTGQQVKIVEAMSYGVPVISLRAAAEPTPMRHGVNGLIAEDAEEFAGHVVRLWADRALCRRLGEAARETIAAEYSRERLLQGLSAALEAPNVCGLTAAEKVF